MINIKLNRKTKQKIDFTKSSSEHLSNNCENALINRYEDYYM